MKKYILLAAAAISITACNTEDNYIDEPVAAHISATIGESTLARAHDVTWDANDCIGISMSGRYTNYKYTTENGDGVFSGATIYFKNKQEPVTISAYYPYTGTEGQAPDVFEVSTKVDRQTPDLQSEFDFLYAVKENVTGSEPDVHLAFSHMMSKLTLVFKKGNDGTDVSRITSCVISGLVLEGTFNPVTGACAANIATAEPLELTPEVVDGKALPSLILLPQPVEKVMMKITDNQDQEYSCELKFDGNRLESGNNYLFTIRVNKTGLNIEKYAITNWTENTDIFDAASE